MFIYPAPLRWPIDLILDDSENGPGEQRLWLSLPQDGEPIRVMVPLQGISNPIPDQILISQPMLPKGYQKIEGEMVGFSQPD